MALTPQARIVDALLRERYGTSLESFIHNRRSEGFSFHRIARELDEFTDGTVEVTGQTVGNWTAALQRAS